MGLVSGEPPVPTPLDGHKPSVQIAILLDTSNSMDGLIAQAKSQLWTIVNTLATAKHKGVRPSLQVALYEYGKSSLPSGEGFLRQILPLTTDLDEVSAQLFALTTNGGEEYCGHVIDAATKGLLWSDRSDDLRFILIAGNEPFTQGGIDYRHSIPMAVKKGIVVNTIHCGNEQVGIETNWKDGALLGEGAYSFIDTNAAAVHIPSPYDAQITTLSNALNKTYLGYGSQGLAMAERQSAQDSNAASAAPGAAVQRAQTKAGEQYRNVHWDLVDAVKEKVVSLATVDADELPEEMRGMTVEQREAHVRKLETERVNIQRQIGELSRKREEFVASERAKHQNSQARTLEGAVIGALQAQAKRKGYEFDPPAAGR